MDERKRDSIIAYIQRRMTEYGISVEQLAASLSSGEEKYRNAGGETWNGEGDMPEWMKQAVSAGQAPDHFAVDSSSAANPRRTDWRQDPFAGSRLATIKA